MQRFLANHVLALKFLGFALVVAFAGSALSTHLASKLLLEVGVDGPADSPTDGGGEDDEEAEAEEALASAKERQRKALNDRALASMASKSSRKQASADAVVANNIFCPSCVPVDEQAPVLANAGTQSGEIQSQLRLQLLATMESDDPLWSMATIRDLDSNSLGPYTPNEEVRPGVTIFSVERGRVVLLNQGRREFINLGDEPPAATAPPKPAASPKKSRSRARGGKSVAIDGADQAIDCSSENSCTVDRKFVDQLLAQPQQLMTQARMYPVSRDGENAGFRVAGVRSGSLATMIGLKNGDVVSEINGQKLGSIDDALGMYQKLRRASHLSVVVERGGAVITKEISIK